MPFSRRSRLSLAQLLTLQPEDVLDVLLKKHELFTGWPPSESLPRVCVAGSQEKIAALIDEVARTKGDLRARVNPRHRFDQRLADLVKCLQLDGYSLDG